MAKVWPILVVSALACGVPEPSIQPDPGVRTGAEVLVDLDFDRLIGKRVGLVTNHTAIVDSTHLIDILAADDRFELAALFGPEHGLRGLAQAGDKVGDGIDPATGIPVYSLYGARRSPPDSVLADLDILLFDIQDIGARFYTYISTMGRSMQAASRAGVPFVVLDRPNPLGRLAEGAVLDSADFSFVGLYPIPITHGMTVGELALMIRGEALLEDLEDLDLDVVPISGWRPDQLWPSYKDTWVKTSPNIPDFETALIYPGAGLFEGTVWSEGRGTQTPFKHVGAQGISGENLARSLNDLGLPGVRFEADSFVPEPIPSMDMTPKLEGRSLQGVRIVITDPTEYLPVTTGIHMVGAAFAHTPEDQRAEFFKSRWMRLISGGSELESMLLAGSDASDIVAAWQDDVAAFKERRRRYLLY